MKRQIILLITTTLIALSSISQTSNDSVICIPNSQLKKAITIIEKSKVTEEELSLSKVKLSIFQTSLSVKDSLISVYKSKEIDYKNILQNQTNAITLSNRIITNLEKNIEINAKLIRRQKTKKWIVGLLGIGIGIILTK
jgi:NAD+--asparagine ADP-ribosyltransferase